MPSISTLTVNPGYIDVLSSTDGQLLTSNGTAAYWANASGIVAAGQSISVLDLTSGNSTVNVVVNSTTISISGSNVVTSSTYYAGYYALPSISF